MESCQAADSVAQGDLGPGDKGGLKSERCEVVHSAKKTMFMLAKLAWLNACKSLQGNLSHIE